MDNCPPALDSGVKQSGLHGRVAADHLPCTFLSAVALKVCPGVTCLPVTWGPHADGNSWTLLVSVSGSGA